MAAAAYFKKVRENDSSIAYAYGSDAEAMTSELVLDKETRRPSVGADSLGYTGRKAAGKIVQLYLDQGDWPEKGASVS